MPELPEVETIRRQLAPHLEGRTIESVEILDPRWTRPAAPGGGRAGCAARVWSRSGRAGKYLVWSLSASGICSCTCG